MSPPLSHGDPIHSYNTYIYIIIYNCISSLSEILIYYLYIILPQLQSEEKQISELIRDAVIFSNGCIKWTTSTFIQWIADNSLLPDFENSM